MDCVCFIYVVCVVCLGSVYCVCGVCIVCSVYMCFAYVMCLLCLGRRCGGGQCMWCVCMYWYKGVRRSSLMVSCGNMEIMWWVTNYPHFDIINPTVPSALGWLVTLEETR